MQTEYWRKAVNVRASILNQLVFLTSFVFLPPPPSSLLQEEKDGEMWRKKERKREEKGGEKKKAMIVGSRLEIDPNCMIELERVSSCYAAIGNPFSSHHLSSRLSGLFLLSVAFAGLFCFIY